MQFLRKIGDILDTPEGAAASDERPETLRERALPGSSLKDAAQTGEDRIDFVVVTRAEDATSEAVAPREIEDNGSAEADACMEEADAAARTLRAAAEVAEVLSVRLPAALRRASVAEGESRKLKRQLQAAVAKADNLQAQQLRLTEGFEGELRQRDSEIAALRQALGEATADHGQSGVACNVPPGSESPGGSLSVDGSADSGPGNSSVVALDVVEVLTFATEGSLGLEFNVLESPFVVSHISTESLASGRVQPGDEVLSIGGISTSNMSFEDLRAALSQRPAIVSFRRGSMPREDAASQRSGFLPGDRVRGVVGRFGKGLRSMIDRAAEGQEWLLQDQQQPGDGTVATVSSVPEKDATSIPSGPMDDNEEDRNRPFFELVRTSMAEAMAAGASQSKAENWDSEGAFQAWLRQFHNERDDEWFQNNHTRVDKAFRPHWQEVLAAQRTL